ncbi:hypothetical protein ACWEOE_31160 [Amycolatopsis sp. NPDC004368]
MNSAASRRFDDGHRQRGGQHESPAAWAPTVLTAALVAAFADNTAPVDVIRVAGAEADLVLRLPQTTRAAEVRPRQALQLPTRR